jgi:AraC-like DNA-binding protein
MSLLFAKPETTLHLEDIALRFSLEDLQKMFFKSIDTLQQRFQETNSFPFTDTPQIFLALREVTKELHKDTLYGYCILLSYFNFK